MAQICWFNDDKKKKQTKIKDEQEECNKCKTEIHLL